MDVVARRASHEIGRMEQAAQGLAAVFSSLRLSELEGRPAAELDRFVRRALARRGLQSALVGYRGYPAHCSVSPNDTAVHGVPGQRPLQRGDVFSLDIAAASGGWLADMAWTYLMPGASRRAETEYGAAWRAYRGLLRDLETGMSLEELAECCEQRARAEGLRPIAEFTGHGIGRELHEAPVIPLAREAVQGRGAARRIRLEAGMVVSIEPVYRPIEPAGHATILADPDGWAYHTSDGARTYHFELSIAFDARGPWILPLGCSARDLGDEAPFRLG